MKLNGLPASSPCQRYRPVESFLPLCHERETSKTMTSVKPVHSKGLIKKISNESNALKSSDRKSPSVKIHPPNTTSSIGDERLSKWNCQGFHHTPQKDGLLNTSGQLSSLPSSQLKDLKSDKGRNKKKVQQIGRANNSRKISPTEKLEKKGQEELRGIASKLVQTKRTVEKKTRSSTSVEQVKTSDAKKDPLFKQMVEEEQHRWSAEVKKAEDKRKEFYCISESLRISFKVDWISYNVSLDPVPAVASVGTSKDLQNGKKDFTENLNAEVLQEKSHDTVFTKMIDEIKEDSRDMLETSVVQGLVDDAEEMSAGEADNTDDAIVVELSVTEAETGDFKVNSQQKGQSDGKLVEEMLPADLEKTCVGGKSNTDTKTGWFDGNYSKGSTKDRNSVLCNDGSQFHDESSSPKFEMTDGQLVNGMLHSESKTNGFEVKFANVRSLEKANETGGAGNKELLLEVPPVKTEIENDDNQISKEMSPAKAGADDFEEEAVTFNPNIMPGYTAPSRGDAAEEDDAKRKSIQESELKSEADAVEGKVGPDVTVGDTGRGDTSRRSFDEISLGKTKVNDDTSGKTGFERKDGELKDVFDVSLSVSDRRNLDLKKSIQTESAARFEEAEVSELPVHLMEEPKQNVSVDNNLTLASLAQTEAESSCLLPGNMLDKNQSLKKTDNSSKEDDSLQELCQRSMAKYESCQEDTVVQTSFQEEPHSQESLPKKLDNITSETDLQISSQRKSDATGSQDKKGLESNMYSLLDNVGRDLTCGSDKSLKLNLANKGNKKNMRKAKSASGDIPCEGASYMEDVSMGDFHATVAVRDGTAARHSTTVDVVCLDVGSAHAPVTPLITLIGDSISA